MNISDSGLVARYDMEVSACLDTCHSNHFFHRKIRDGIHGKILRYDINDLITCWKVGFILIFNQCFNIFFFDFFFDIGNHSVSTCLNTFDMMACNTHIDFFDSQTWIAYHAISECDINRAYTFFDVEYHPMIDTAAIGFSKAKDF